MTSPSKPHEPFFARLWHRTAKGVCQLLFIPLYRLKAFKRQNVPRTGPALILCNHQSFFDPIFCQVWLGRPFWYAARDNLFDHWLMGPLLRSVYTMPIKRGQADLHAMRAIMDKLNQGFIVLLYPEGTRSPDGRITEIKPGFSLLSRRTGAPILPMVIDGAHEAWPRSRKWPGLAKVAVLYGEPISADEVKRLGDRELTRLLTERLIELQAECRRRMGREPFDYSDRQAAAEPATDSKPKEQAH